MDPESGSSLLLSQLKKVMIPECEVNHELAKGISEMLGGSPFLINQAGGVLRDCNCSLTKFVARPILIKHKIGANRYEYERPPEQIINRTLGKLSKKAKQFLFTLTFFNHSKIEEDLLLKHHLLGCFDFLQSGDSR